MLYVIAHDCAIAHGLAWGPRSHDTVTSGLGCDPLPTIVGRSAATIWAARPRSPADVANAADCSVMFRPKSAAPRTVSNTNNSIRNHTDIAKRVVIAFGIRQRRNNQRRDAEQLQATPQYV